MALPTTLRLSFLGLLSMGAVVGYLYVRVSKQTNPDQAVEEIDFLAEEVLVIGEDESASSEYLLGSPWHVASDSTGRIYVFDRTIMGIRVYDAEGQYQHTIGRPGEGPGELRDVSAMFVDRDNTLWTTDNFNFRITRFSLDGDVLATYSYSQESITWPRQMGQLHDGRYLVLYRLFRLWQDDLDQHHMLHVFEEPFEEPVESFASTTKFGDLEDPFVANMLGSPTTGSFTVDANGNVLVVPFLYEGKILRYAYDSNQNNWRELEPLVGQVDGRPAYTRITHEPFPDEAYVIHGGEAYAGIIHNESVGIYTLNDGRIVHFTFVRQGDRHVFGIELFSSAGQLLRYGAIEDLPSFDQPVPTSPFMVAWKDEWDQFYMIGRTDLPVVRVVTFDF